MGHIYLKKNAKNMNKLYITRVKVAALAYAVPPIASLIMLLILVRFSCGWLYELGLLILFFMLFVIVENADKENYFY